VVERSVTTGMTTILPSPGGATDRNSSVAPPGLGQDLDSAGGGAKRNHRLPSAAPPALKSFWSNLKDRSFVKKFG
jgi:hypothetical protein